MPFTILSNNDIKSLLTSLSPSDLSSLTTTLQNSLTQYSCASESQYQPHRSVVKRDDQTTLFMPATTPSFTGVKIVGISPPAPASSAPKPGLQATLTICDAAGQAVGVLNAAEITAFRTALGSMLLYTSRARTENVVVFGAGAQAHWHIRLALLLRGDEIRRIVVVNRSRVRAEELVEELRGMDGVVPPHVRLEVFDQGEGGAGEEALGDVVADADVVFTGVPSTSPVLKKEWFVGGKARARGTGKYVAAIGSYRLDMQEIDPGLLEIVADPEGEMREQVWDGKVVVDSAEGCLVEAGELVKAGIGKEGMLEVGRLAVMRESGSTALEGLEKWLRDGFVVYKSVGVGVMDIAIGSKLLELAGEKGLGARVEDF
ncbi:hypothetical protein E8E13_003998 [Curvularia kusanoi]|uniref:Ornithine cyclodeaminase n=1 Tax=Curvularia kusanoi TaxID=90978 RepID=A0A9P4W6X5_CURKU|nr:hypothetical protein E8E13_003998 [Curvularia kusanoi]